MHRKKRRVSNTEIAVPFSMVSIGGVFFLSPPTTIRVSWVKTRAEEAELAMECAEGKRTQYFPDTFPVFRG